MKLVRGVWKLLVGIKDALVLVAMLLFFGLSSGKREVYILPGLPVFCPLLGPWLAEVLPRRWPRRLLRGFALLLGGALLLVRSERASA